MEDGILKKVVAHLMSKGLENEEISQILSDIAEASYEQFLLDVQTYFTEEDLRLIDDIKDKVISEQEVKKLYELRTGRDANEYMSSLITEQANLYLHDAESQPILNSEI